MLPTPVDQCRGRGWWSTPNIDYSLKHSFSWPTLPTAEAAQAAASGMDGGAAKLAGSTLVGGMAGGAGGHLPPHAPPPNMHWQYNGRYPGFHHRGNGIRRLVWFGLGIGAAAIYYRSKERHREEARRYVTEHASRVSRSSGAKDSWNDRFPDHATPSMLTDNVTAPVRPAEHHATISADNSAILAALREHRAQVGLTDPESIVERKHWGWGARREKRREEKAQAARDVASQESRPVGAQSTISRAPKAKENDMATLRAAVEELWEENKKAAVEAQQKAHDQAKEYARQKLEVLSASLEKLRKSLEQDVDAKVGMRQADGKTV